ncbi:MAG: protein BatD [Paludibacteraceae bacterium]|nr:protein BatD [Paludibacteraceae bacterium]MBN2787091.1 protein BatD [Paludibacteraceae bacterium]
MKKIVLIISLLIGYIANSNAVQFQASAPTSIPAGKAFRLVYTLDDGNGKDLQVADLANFDVLAGPFESRSSSVQIINGQVNSSTTVSYTYTLTAKKEGTFTIPAASIFVDQKKYISNALTIHVLPADKTVPAESQKRNSNQGSVDKVLSDESLFIRAIPSRTRLLEQDFILITYKMYSLVDVVGISPNSVKLPDFSGFLKQEIDLPKTSQLSFENYKGKNYSTVILYQALLYPQQSGALEIDKASFEAVVRIRTKAQVRSIFDNFFDTYQDVKKKLNSPAIKITVDKLPANKPATFNGAVGKFSFTSSLSSKTVAVNDAVTLKYTISGNGNLKLIKTPEIEFPSDLEVYDPKITNNFKHTSSGVTGSKIIEYLIIPRSEGDFKIPSYTFTYFDLNSKTYKEITAPEYKLHVKKGIGNSGGGVVNFSNQEQLKLLGQDIRYIYTDTPTIKQKNNFFFGSLLFWLLIFIPLLVAILFFVVYRKQLKENANIQLVKNRKANKMAVKRLKTANKYLLENKNEEFYDEVLKALWGYLSDKLVIPVSSLSKENVEIELEKKNVIQSDIDEFMDLLSVCEFERYSPLQNSQAMDTLYNRAISIISKFQHSIK